MRSLIAVVVALCAGACEAVVTGRMEAPKPTVGKAPTGTLMSAQFFCDVNPCEQNWGLYLTSTGLFNAPRIQQYLPSAPLATREFQVYTAYDEGSRTFVTAASGYPRAGLATMWSSKISADGQSASFIVDGVVVTWPNSQSPYPLNIHPLDLNRILFGANGQLYATFKNGEVHKLDLASGTSTHHMELFTPAAQLSAQHPAMTWAQVYDSATDSLRSVKMEGGVGYGELPLAYISQASLTVPAETKWVPMAMAGGNAGFAPEQFTNAMMIDLPDGTREMIVTVESANNQGFDMVVFANSTTGQMSQWPEFNLMENEILFMCPPTLDCDLWRVSTIDTQNCLVYFQGHSGSIDDEGAILFMVIGFDVNRETGNLNWYMNDAGYNAYGVGYTGHQWVNIANATTVA